MFVSSLYMSLMRIIGWLSVNLLKGKFIFIAQNTLRKVSEFGVFPGPNIWSEYGHLQLFCPNKGIHE